MSFLSSWINSLGLSILSYTDYCWSVPSCTSCWLDRSLDHMLSACIPDLSEQYALGWVAVCRAERRLSLKEGRQCSLLEARAILLLFFQVIGVHFWDKWLRVDSVHLLLSCLYWSILHIFGLNYIHYLLDLFALSTCLSCNFRVRNVTSFPHWLVLLGNLYY